MEKLNQFNPARWGDKIRKEMSEQEYRDELKTIEAHFEQNKKALARKYAFANQMFQIGDTLQKGDTIIIVDRVKWGFGYSMPSAVYEGNKLTTKLEPPKRGDKRDTIWQMDGADIIKIPTP